MSIAIRINAPALAKAIRKDLSRVEKEVLPKAFKAAIPKLARKVRTRTTREVGGRSRVKQKLIRSRITGGWTKGKRAYVIGGKAEPIPLALLAPQGKDLRQVSTRKGVRVGRHSVAGAFPARSRLGRGAGSMRIFKRDGRSRGPISEQKIEIDQHMKAALPAAATAIMASEFEKEMRSQVSRFTKPRTRKIPPR